MSAEERVQMFADLIDSGNAHLAVYHFNLAIAEAENVQKEKDALVADRWDCKNAQDGMPLDKFVGMKIRQQHGKATAQEIARDIREGK